MRHMLETVWGRRIIAAMALLTLSYARDANAAAIVGTAGAANTQSTSVPPGGGVRVIEIGSQVVQNEKIETSASGSVQLLFIDKTTLNIGPRSSVVIDRFVFNPVTTQGELVVTLSKGALRLVGGQATHTGGATITTPVAAIGVRGGIVTVTQSSGEGTRAFLGYGVMTITSRCLSGSCTPETQTVRRPGFMVQVGSAGGEPTQPVKASAGLIDNSNIQLTSKVGQTGGATLLPSDQQASTYNVGTVNSQSAPQVAASPPQSGARGSSIAAIQTAQMSAQSGEQNAGASVTAQIVASSRTSSLAAATPPVVPPVVTQPVVTMPVTPPAYPSSAFLLTTTVDSAHLGQSQFPFLLASFVSSGAFSVTTPLYGYRASSAAGAAPNDPRVFQANFAVNGQGASQTSMISVMTAEGANDAVNGNTFIGNFFGTSVPNASNYNSWTRGFVTSTPGSITLDANLLPTGSFDTTQNSFKSSSTTVTNGYANPPTQSYAYLVASGTNNNYLTNQTVSRGSTPASLGVDHPTETLQGYAGGMFGTYQYAQTATSNTFIAGSPLYVVTNGTNSPGDVSVNLYSGSRIEAVFNVAAITQSYVSGNPNFQANALQNAQYRFGNPQTLPNGAQASGDNGAYVDTRNFAALSERAYNVSGPDYYTSSANGVTYNQPALAGGSTGFLYSLMVVSDAVGANTQSFLSSISSTTVTPCVCDYTRWGFWSVQGHRNDAVNSDDYYEQTHLALWVAGLPTTAASIPITGTATYTGHAIAQISNYPYQYLAAGSFSNTVNFAARTGQVAINGLDATNYAGTVNLTPSSTLFAGNLTGNVGGRTAALNGSFFQGGPTNSTPLYGEMAGSLTLSGTNYLGSGIFAGRKP